MRPSLTVPPTSIRPGTQGPFDGLFPLVLPLSTTDGVREVRLAISDDREYGSAPLPRQLGIFTNAEEFVQSSSAEKGGSGSREDERASLV